MTTKIREITPGDTEAVLNLGRDLGMFDEAGVEMIGERLAAHFAGNSDELWLVADDAGMQGCLYCVPELMTDGTWNALMLMVGSDHHGKGVGRMLMTSAEDFTAQRDGRLLLVETSSLDEFETARAFYDALGYQLQGRVRDYYEDGDDKVMFTKSLRGDGR